MDSLKEKLIDIHFNGQLELYLSEKIEDENYNVLISDVIDDYYWNLAYITKDNVNIDDCYNNIKNTLEKYHRNPVLYVTSNFNNIQINKEKYEELYHDLWLYNDNIINFENYKSEIDFNVYRVDDKLKDLFIESVMKGFSGDNPDDPYEALSDGYKIALYQSFDNNESQYKVQHYLGMYHNESICTTTVIYKDNIALVYNVTTNKAYQRKGVCKSMMSKMIKDLLSLGINIVGLQTEKGFYTENVYKNMGFKETLEGIAYRAK